jgi:UTP--glucose-1-phosphate uridylyltransferase
MARGRLTAVDGLEASLEKMRREGLPDAAIDTFEHYYRQLAEGETGMLPESEIEPVEDPQDLESLPGEDAPLDEAVILKLNGGLGTSMGMTHAKSLIEAKDGMTFLDVIARQVLELRRRSGARLPLVLMNSFYTHEESLEALAKHELESDVPPDFVQHKEPKIRTDDLTPVEWPADPSLEWCPPGHGDLYTALLTSGMLDALLEHGYRYAFVSNSDNLGAVLEPRILSWMAREQIPFVMEITDRTEADRKGGHIAHRPGGGFVLRETAQTPEEDLAALQDISRHRYVNTNNLWVDLRALADVLREREGVLGLPLIVNPAADRQPQDRRPGRQVHARGVPARDRDGGGDRRFRRRPAGARPAAAVLAGQEHRGPACPALGRLRARRRRARGTGARARRDAARRRPRRRPLQAPARLRRALREGRAVAGGL